LKFVRIEIRRPKRCELFQIMQRPCPLLPHQALITNVNATGVLLSGGAAVGKLFPNREAVAEDAFNSILRELPDQPQSKSVLRGRSDASD
jgi:hypothetical protein